MPDETKPTTETEPKPGPGGGRRSSFRPPADVGAASTAKKEAEAKADADKKADDGHPDPLAQINLVKPAGPSGLIAALHALPPIPALDGIKANAEHASTEELVSALKTLPLPEDNQGALDARDEIVRRLEAGEFRR
jgi:hypothetical protein